MRWSLFLCLFSLVSFLGAEEASAWVWTAEEQAKIDNAVKYVKQVNGWYKVESANWIVETQIEARATAEWALFMERFSAAMQSIVGFGTQDAKNVADKPLVKIYAKHDDYVKLYFIPPQQCASLRDKKALLGRNEMGVSGA